MTKLNTLQVRMDDEKKEFNKLVGEKETETDPKRIEGILNAMVDVNKRINRDAEEYNGVLRDISYRYPSKNAELNQLYETREKRSLEEMQSDADLDEMLTGIRKVIDRKFAPSMPENKSVRAPAARTEEAPKKLKLEK